MPTLSYMNLSTKITTPMMTVAINKPLLMASLFSLRKIKNKAKFAKRDMLITGTMSFPEKNILK
jgi:hypothetical protein